MLRVGFPARVPFLPLFLLVLAGCGPRAPEIQTYSLGERVQTGPLVYNAFDTHWALSLGSGPTQRIPSNRFLVVHLSISNGGATDSSVPTLMLIDDQNQTFSELSDGTGVANWLGVVRKIEPVKSIEGNIVFDVAPKHYKLRVADETEQIVAMIDLPLNLTPEEKGQ